MDASFFDKAFYIGLLAGILGVFLEGAFCMIKYKRWESHVTTAWGQYNIVYGLGATVLYILAMALPIPKLFWKIIVMALLVTLVEFVCGLILKYWLGMKAWDYSKQPLNIMGLICPAFTFAWALLSLVMCLICKPLTKMLEPLTIEPLHIVAVVLFFMLVADLALALVYTYRWSRRHYGKGKTGPFSELIDKWAPDDWMKARFMEWKFLDEE